ncbi:MAG: efflux transporter outer membrane subunit [Paucibacter sp.]|nr:efflux transporter outer membrane subunit [Roseateles sp.]
MKHFHTLTAVARAVVCLGAGALLAACAVGPDYQRPSLPQAKHLAPAEVERAMLDAHQIAEADVPAQWWQLYQSSALDRLVQAALEHNPSVPAAQAALRAAAESRRAQQAAYFPTVQASYTGARQRVADALASPLSSGASVFNVSTAQLSVSYTPDVFGANRRQVESLEAQEQSQRWNVEATYLTLSANVVVAAIGEAGLNEQIAATRQQIALQADLLARYRQLQAVGANSQLDVLQQEAQLASLEASLPALQKQLAQQRDQLKALVGVLPEDDSIATFRLDDLHLPEPLPRTLPSSLVEHRPDVLAAEAQAQSAAAQLGVAIANRLPTITLGVDSWGSSAASLTHLFGAGSTFWSLTGGVSQTIFDAGALKHRSEAARAAYDEAEATYRGTVINAFQNVADALQAVQADATGEVAAQKAFDAAQRTFEISRRQLELGDTSALAVIQAEQAMQQALVARVQARVARLTDAAGLIQALGGGWWNRPPNEPPPQSSSSSAR